MAEVSQGCDPAAIAWETTSADIAAISPGGSRCSVTGLNTGVSTVSAALESASAAVTTMVVDASDLTAGNYDKVRKAVARHEDLMDEDQGDDVIWTMITASLVTSGIKEERAKTAVGRVKAAEDDYRGLYVYAFGSYDVAGDATRDGRGSAISTSHYNPTDNTVYMTRSTLSGTNYAYVLLHETGHAIDYNVGGNRSLDSLNNDAYEAIVSDIRSLLGARVVEAADGAGIDLAEVNADRVIDAVLDYRELTQHDLVMSALTADEQKLYAQLVATVKAEINATLPKNNGTMVWDAIEGATNFAISGSYGHAYMFDIPAYQSIATYYFYDKSGNPMISSEPWAEFFAAGIMGDSDTIAVNEAYLPETCKYFAETLLPSALNWFKAKVLAA